MDGTIVIKMNIVIPALVFGMVIYKVVRRLKEGAKLFPPEYVFMILFIQSLLHFYFPIKQIIYYPYTLLGLLALIIRYGSRHYIRSAFDCHNTTIRPLEKSTFLFTTGIYGYVRNPIYLIMTIFLVGTAVLFGSLSPLLIVPVFPLFVNYRFVRFEERILEETFGEEYLQYKKKVRRWV